MTSKCNRTYFIIFISFQYSFIFSFYHNILHVCSLRYSYSVFPWFNFTQLLLPFAEFTLAMISFCGAVNFTTVLTSSSASHQRSAQCHRWMSIGRRVQWNASLSMILRTAQERAALQTFTNWCSQMPSRFFSHFIADHIVE